MGPPPPPPSASASSTTVINQAAPPPPPTQPPKNQGGCGGVQMDIVPINGSNAKTSLVTTVGRGGAGNTKDMGTKGGDTTILLHDGTTVVAGGGDPGGTDGAGTIGRNQVNIQSYMNYGQGGLGRAAGTDGFAAINVFSLVVTKK